MLSPICEGCERLYKECEGADEKSPWTACALKIAPTKNTYIVTIGGRWYALKSDLFMHYVFGIAQDAGRYSEVITTRGSTEGRNAAILKACTPFDTWREAYDTATAEGVYLGQLYT